MLANTGSEICTVVPKPRPGFVERLLHSDYTPRKYRIVCAVVREYGTHGPEHTIRVAAHLVWGLPIRRGSMVLLERDLVAPRVPADDIRFAQVTRINGRPNETTLSVKWRRNRDEAEERETEPPWPLPRQKPASDTAPQNGTATRLAKLWVSNQPGEVQITTGDNESALFSLTTLQIVTEASISMLITLGLIQSNGEGIGRVITGLTLLLVFVATNTNQTREARLLSSLTGALTACALEAAAPGTFQFAANASTILAGAGTALTAWTRAVQTKDKQN